MIQVNFRFSVTAANVSLGIFTECTLPTIEWEVQKIIEGGLNTYVHQLPTRRKESKVILKQGLGSGNEILLWYKDCLAEKFLRKDVTIHMLDAKTHKPVYSWTAKGAYPISWKGPQLQTGGKAVAIETLELACHEIIVDSDTKLSSNTWWLERNRSRQRR
ncbi:MAG: phage tail protein [Anaerolineales bacterium]|nr:phage tail protein [Anaerolineales bacterium]